MLYHEKMKALIAGWRSVFNNQSYHSIMFNWPLSVTVGMMILVCPEFGRLNWKLSRFPYRHGGNH